MNHKQNTKYFPRIKNIGDSFLKCEDKAFCANKQDPKIQKL